MQGNAITTPKEVEGKGKGKLNDEDSFNEADESVTPLKRSLEFISDDDEDNGKDLKYDHSSTKIIKVEKP